MEQKPGSGDCASLEHRPRKGLSHVVVGRRLADLVGIEFMSRETVIALPLSRD